MMLIMNILISNKYCIGKKCFNYFIGYVNPSYDDVKALLIRLPKLDRSIKSFENQNVYDLCCRKSIKTYYTIMLKNGIKLKSLLENISMPK